MKLKGVWGGGVKSHPVAAAGLPRGRAEGRAHPFGVHAWGIWIPGEVPGMANERRLLWQPEVWSVGVCVGEGGNATC